MERGMLALLTLVISILCSLCPAQHLSGWGTIRHPQSFSRENTLKFSNKHNQDSSYHDDREGIRVVTEDALFTVDPQFLSMALGINQMKNNWKEINFTAPRIINMARGLTPAMLRLGGTNADFLLFNTTCSSIQSLTSKPLNFDAENFTNSTFCPSEWDAVNHFVKVVDWEFIFGLNGLLRSPYPDGVWDSENAQLLMSYCNTKNYSVNWELGNEPNAWSRFNYTITPSQHGADFTILKDLIATMKPAGSIIAGPDVSGRDADYLMQFLQAIEKDVLNVITYHHYYMDGRTATENQFYDVNVLDSFMDVAINFKSVTEKYAPYVDVWIGETSSTFGGGTPGLSDAYIAGFMWLDKLGIAAMSGHKRVFRQDLRGGAYAILDSNQDPLPDYWLSLLYKKLVGTKVLYVVGSMEYGRQLRVYAHCSKPPYPAGSIVLLILNLNFTSLTVDLLNKELMSSERDVFWLTPPSSNLTSKSVQLNGVTLELLEDRDLPDLKAVHYSPSPTLSIPSISFGFIVFNNSNIIACVE